MKSEKEIREGLAKCEKVADWGISKGPCPFDPEGKRGCCAECSFTSALYWVLTDQGNPSANGQDKLIETLGDL